MRRRIESARGAVCAALSWLLAGCVTVNVAGGGVPGELVETVVHGKRGPKILLLDVDGPISTEEEQQTFGLGERESLVARVSEQLSRAAEDSELRAVVVRINSPGGTVTGSEILYGELLRFKQESGLPIVAELMGVATSGAYMAAMAADVVLAQPTSVTGSIGVIFAGVNFAGLMEKLGIENQTLKTGSFKDAGTPLRPMTDAEREQLQSVLDDLHARFLEVVTRGRPEIDPELLARLADGRIFSAGQALEHGLVDGIATLPEAVQEAERRAGIESSRVVSYHRSREWRENLYSRSFGAPLASELATLLGPVRGPAFLYLWWPGVR